MKDATEHPTIPTGWPHNSDSAQDVNSAEAEKPWWRGNTIFLHHLMYQAVLITGFFSVTIKMVPSEMNREMANQREL